MDIKKIFNRKSRQEGAEATTPTDTTSITHPPSVSSASPRRPVSSSYTESEGNFHDDAASFQYSYNSNSNSLFSSKRTLSTSQSSHPSSNFSYGKGSSGHDQQTSKITTLGRPLRVLSEEDDEDDDEEEGKQQEQEEEEEEEEVEGEMFEKNMEVEKEKELNSLFDSSSFVSTSPRLNMINKSQTFARKSSLFDDSAAAASAVLMTSTLNERPSMNSPTIARTSFSNDSLIGNKCEVEARAQLGEFIKSQLRSLSSSISHIIMQIAQSVYNLTRASIRITESIEATILNIRNHRNLHLINMNQFTTSNSIGLRRLVKHTLNLFDNILTGSAYDKSKALIMKNLYELFTMIKALPESEPELTNFNNFMTPVTFPIDEDANKLPEAEKVDNLMNNLLMKEKDKSKLFADQDGSFIAPVQRGFCIPTLSILTFIFGFPKLSKEHHDVIKYFAGQLDSVHFLLQKNRIVYASANVEKPRNIISEEREKLKSRPIKRQRMKLKSPFRTIEDDQEYIPISMSLSTDNATISSGTLGGYLYPKVPNNCMNSKILKYRGNVFGLTCAHVVLGKENGRKNGKENGHPDISIPSSVLINLYKNALVNEMMNHSETSPEYSVYSDAVRMIDEEYPVQKVQIEGKRSLYKNLPKNKFGNIIWGERLIDNNKLSDIAIIKINAELQKKKYVNYLGEDLQLSQYDPSLILSNLNVKKIVTLQPRKNGIFNTANLNVFKVGSTTGYTEGRLNGMKMIYWADGTLRSSEFIISGTKGKMDGFANGGDSGAWILSKMCDVNKFTNGRGGNYDDYSDIDADSREDGNYDSQGENSDEDIEEEYTKNSLTSFIESFIPGGKTGKKSGKGTSKRGNARGRRDNTRVDDNGLGVLGMLHSYDGEFKQFGLFTPMHDILDRLEQVTGVEWGVVGCSEEDDLDYKSISSGQSITTSEISIDE